MLPFAAILSLLTGISGWYYLFHSRAAQRLSGVEDERINLRRIRLRRFGGATMLLLAVGLYLGFYAASDQVRPTLFVGVWCAVMILMVLLVVLAMLDVRLTFKLRNQRLRRRQGTAIDRVPPP
jgi:hypothetical protein